MRRAAILAGALAAMLSGGAALAQPPAAGEALLVAATPGQVTLRRVGWTNRAPAAAGAVIRRGDLVFVAAGGKATVACPDLKLHVLPPGRASGIPCPATAARPLVYGGSLLAPTRSDISADLPVVIAPRRTKVLDGHPTLRWAPLTADAAYTISVRGPGVTWTMEAPRGATSMLYPMDAPALAAGETYKVTVTGDGHSSDELNEPNLGFSVLPDETGRQVKADVAALDALGLDPAAAQMAAAHVYASAGLHAEAITRLEPATTAAGAQLLGTLYQAAGLNRQAETAYLQASKLATTAGDPEGVAVAQRALGILYQDVFGQAADASQAFTQAIAAFGKLGDAAAVAALKARATP